MSAIINVATKAAYAAANIISRASTNLRKINVKKKNGKNDLVTDIDKAAEEIIISTIKKAFPDHNILAEESGVNIQGSPYTWIIDPIDGTTNFIHGHPQYCVSIGIKYENKITHGVILDLNRNDLYKAEYGKGAFVNDKRLRVSKVNYLEDSLVATGFPTYDMSIVDKYLAIFKDMLIHTSGHRRCGSAALDLAFNGDFHAMWSPGIARSGYAPVGGPTWLDWNQEFKATEVPQIVGHTIATKVRTKVHKPSGETSYCLDTALRHVMWTDGEDVEIVTL